MCALLNAGSLQTRTLEGTVGVIAIFREFYVAPKSQGLRSRYVRARA